MLHPKEETYPSRKSFLLSWIWISSSTTKRNADNWGIFGDEDVECVRLGNQMAARWALLALVCTIMNIFWVVPEPQREDLSNGICNQIIWYYQFIFCTFGSNCTSVSNGGFQINGSTQNIQNGLLLKSMIGQFPWGGTTTKFMPTGLPICFPCTA